MEGYQITKYEQALAAIFIHKKIEKEAIYLQSNNESGSPQSGVSKRAQYLFPTPESVSNEGINFFCDAKRVIAIYNKQHKLKREKLTSSIQEWFIHEALRCGWAHAEFINDVQLNGKVCFLQKLNGSENVYVSKQ